jgi:hypothetical protein
MNLLPLTLTVESNICPFPLHYFELNMANHGMRFQREREG